MDSASNDNVLANYKLNIKHDLKPDIVQPLSNVLIDKSNLNKSVIFECISRSPRSLKPKQIRWFHNGQEMRSDRGSPRFTIYNYFNDNGQDGSVLNFHKLVIDNIDVKDQGEYSILIDNDLKSSAFLKVDNESFVNQKSIILEGNLEKKMKLFKSILFYFQTLALRIERLKLEICETT